MDCALYFYTDLPILLTLWKHNIALVICILAVTNIPQNECIMLSDGCWRYEFLSLKKRKIQSSWTNKQTFFLKLKQILQLFLNVSFWWCYCTVSYQSLFMWIFPYQSEPYSRVIFCKVFWSTRVCMWTLMAVSHLMGNYICNIIHCCEITSEIICI